MECEGFRQVFWFPNMLFRATCYDFQGRPRPQWRQYLLNASQIFCITSGFFARYYSFTQEYTLIKAGDMLNSIRLSTFVIYAIDTTLKFTVFMTNRKRLRKIYDTLAEEYPRTPEACRRYDVDRYRLSDRIHRLFYCYFTVTNIILFTPMLESIVRYCIDAVRVGKDEATFLYLHITPMPYDFDFHTPLRYLWVYLSEYMNCHFCTFTNAGIDLFLCVSVGQICMHFEYIGRELMEYEPSEEHDNEDCEFLIELIRKHQLMFALSTELDNIFGISLVFNLMTTSAVICVTAVGLTLLGFAVESSKWIGFFLGVIAQLYIVCFYGQKLITSSENVALAGYKNRWYGGSKRYKKLLLTIIIRAQKRADVTAKGYHSISLETFQIIMGMTYRLFTVLHTMIT